MKKPIKVLAVLLAVGMMFSMATPAYAAGTNNGNGNSNNGNNNGVGNTGNVAAPASSVVLPDEPLTSDAAVLDDAIAPLELSLPVPAPSNNGNNGNNGNSGNGNGNGNGSVKTETVSTVYLKGTGGSFSEAGWQNIFQVGNPEEYYLNGASPEVWHLVYSGKNFNSIVSMQVTFTNGVVFNWTPDMGPSVNGGGNNMGWVIMAPYGWVIDYVNRGNNNESGSFVTFTETSNVQFNISGYKPGTPGRVATGNLEVTANIAKEHEVMTYQPWWQETYQPVWQKTYQPLWQKVFQPWWQQTLQPYYRPVYERAVASSNSTLVSWIDGGRLGGEWNNNHTYVKVDVNAASSPEGLWFDISDASPRNNRIGVQYNVKIADGALTISFSDDVAYASVGANVYNTPPAAFQSAPQHVDNTVTVNLPAGYGDFVYLQFHLSRLNWFPNGPEYTFKGYELYKTEYAGENFVSASLVTDELVCNRLISDDWVYDELVSDLFVENEFVSEATVIDEYAATFALSVLDSVGTEVYFGLLANGSTISIPDLTPGDYTCILSGDDIDELVAVVTVVAGETASIVFDGVLVFGDVEIVYLAPKHLDTIYLSPVNLDPVYLDKVYLRPIWLEKLYLAPVTLDPIYLDDSFARRIN